MTTVLAPGTSRKHKKGNKMKVYKIKTSNGVFILKDHQDAATHIEDMTTLRHAFPFENIKLTNAEGNHHERTF